MKRTRRENQLRIHRRIRHSIAGTSARPRLCVYRSLNHIYVQLVDDESRTTLGSASTLKVGGKKLKNGGNIEAAKKVGTEIAQLAKSKGIETVVFDRGGCIYHGRIKALAEAAREAGLRF